MKKSNLNILIVDDDDVAIESFRRSVRKAEAPFSITEAQDAVEAYEILKGNHPQKKVEKPTIVLLDLNMPRMSGLEFLQVIRADQALRKTVVFMLTTSDSAVDKKAALKFNVAGYMVKEDVGPNFKNLLELLINNDSGDII